MQVPTVVVGNRKSFNVVIMGKFKIKLFNVMVMGQFKLFNDVGQIKVVGEWKGKGRWYRRLKKGNTRERVENSVGKVLGGPIKVVVTPYGGLSLDVDDDEDFRILDAHYREWAAITAAVDPDAG